MWYVYIAKARTGRYYVGITKNTDERISRHNASRGSRFAINQGPFRLVYKSKPFNSKSGARVREMQIKGWKREKKEKLINGDWK
jgi:putative endonuclease